MAVPFLPELTLHCSLHPAPDDMEEDGDDKEEEERLFIFQETVAEAKVKVLLAKCQELEQVCVLTALIV